MPDPHGFIEVQREDAERRPVEQRRHDHREIELPLAPSKVEMQARRCMDCGIPFCHATGCPVHNRIPEFNDLVQRGRWQEASAVLHATNNFPEITGRVCPAPCETACTLAINDNPVAIKQVELQIAERAWEQGWVQPQPAAERTGQRVAIVGSGPAGLAAAQQLARHGHDVVVYERDDRPGGLLRYGIPDFKLDKRIVDQRVEQLAAEGVEFQTGVTIGADISARYLQQQFDAVLLATGATVPRDLDVPGRCEARNVHVAMNYLTQQNRRNAGRPIPNPPVIDAKDKVVVVIGGGDTGSDCVGTAIRQGARAVHQFELMDRPPDAIDPLSTWPHWPLVLRTTTSHEEGCERRWCVSTTGFRIEDNQAVELLGVEVRWERSNGRPVAAPVPGTEFAMPVDLILLACGFLHVEHHGVVHDLGLKLTPQGGIVADAYHTSAAGIFAAGDCVRGASLVVHAIAAGREAAAAIEAWLHAR